MVGKHFIVLEDECMYVYNNFLNSARALWMKSFSFVRFSSFVGVAKVRAGIGKILKKSHRF